MALIDVTDLHVRLGGRAIFEGLNFRVDKGEFLGLLGPNGAGKTTLMRCILGLINYSSGSVSIAGRSGKEARKVTGYVPQRHEVAWDFPVDIATAVLNGRSGLTPFYRGFNAADREAAREAIARVGLSDLSRRPIGQLSGGQRQRVLVARALVTQPEVLLLDEPFTGLDHPSTEQLLSLFQTLSAQGVTLVMSTHNLPEAVHFCSRLTLLNRGVIATGTRSELRDPSVWTRTFGVSSDSPLLASVGVTS